MFYQGDKHASSEVYMDHALKWDHWVEHLTGKLSEVYLCVYDHKL